MIVALVDDLFFSSKISGTAQQLGLTVKIVADRDVMLQEAELNPAMLIFDLNCKSCDAVGLIQEIRGRGHAISMLAFVSHVQTDLVKSAQEAGCERVVARSYFSAHLPEILGAKTAL